MRIVESRLTIGRVGVGLGIRVYQDKVESLIVVTRVHDGPPVSMIPHVETVVLFCQRSRDRVFKSNLSGDQKAEGSLSRTEQLGFSAIDCLSSF
jgi:hypothetical protein